MDTPYGVIYKITCNFDGKVYIGQTTSSFLRRYDTGGSGIERVYRHYKSCKKNNRSFNRHLFFAIEKYGFEYFSVDEALDVAFSREELDQKEKYWINRFNSTDGRFGYNIEFGGNAQKLVPEATREKQSNSQKNRFASDENKQYMFERHHSEETKRKISISKSGVPGHPMPEGNIEKLNEAKRKPILCVTTGETFYYMKDALEAYNIKSQGSLSLACHGQRKSCGKLPDGTKLQWIMAGE